MCIRTRMHVLMRMGLGASTLRMLNSSDANHIWYTHTHNKRYAEKRKTLSNNECQIKVYIVITSLSDYQSFLDISAVQCVSVYIIFLNETDEISQNFLPL